MNFASVLIAFDLDGTIIDASPGIYAAVRLAVEKSSPELRGNLHHLKIGPPLRDMLTIAMGRQDSFLLDGIVGEFRKCYDDGLCIEMSVYPGMLDALHFVKAFGVEMAIVTNKPSLPTSKILAHLNLSHFFSSVISLDSSCGPFSNKSDAIAFLLRNSGKHPRSSLYVGDDNADRVAAHVNQMNFMPVAWGFGDAHITVTEGDLPVVRDAREMADLIGSFMKHQETIC